MDLGNGIEIDFGKVDFTPASDEELRAARDRVDAAGEARGLWVPEAAGQLVVAKTVDVPADLRGQLLASATVDVNHTNQVFEIINSGRRKNQRFDITPAGEQRERLEDQLTEEALEAVAQLSASEDRQPMVIPPLPGAITAGELVTAIDKSSKHGIYGWSGRLSFLKKFPIDALTGYDEQRAESGALTVVSTKYDPLLQGTVDQQRKALEEAQQDYPQLGVAPILTTASLAQRYNGQPNSWQDTYTRTIEVDPVNLGDFDHVVYADVLDRGYAGVDGSRVDNDGAARRQVRLNP